MPLIVLEVGGELTRDQKTDLVQKHHRIIIQSGEKDDQEDKS